MMKTTDCLHDEGNGAGTGADEIFAIMTIVV